MQIHRNTSMIVPLVITPRDVYIGPFGFFFTPIISRLKVHLSSGWVTWAFVNLRPVGRINRSYLGGFLVKLGPTKVALVIILFHCLAARKTNSSRIFVSVKGNKDNPIYYGRMKKPDNMTYRALTFPFPRSDDSEHLIFSHRSDLYK